jgi:hypothetical protein
MRYVDRLMLAKTAAPGLSPAAYLETRAADKEFADKAQRIAVDDARAREWGVSSAGGRDAKKFQEGLKDKKLTGKDLAKYDPRLLSRGQNLKALGSELRGASWRPDNVVRKGWQNLGEGGGGYAGGTGTFGRATPFGAKTLSGVFALGDVKDAVGRSDTTGEGRSRTERLSNALGGFAGGTAGALSAKTVARIGGIGGVAANIGASIGGMAAGYYAGGKLGKGIDYAASKARGVEAGDYTRTQRKRIQKKLEAL